ncbi:uncharacterized protein F5147DRAFT_756637 [Suillus discolor]|uniref:Uncharacterized protein n=1 Tax=Suillus discolor TaxID=1912936 RepID=A0A9P7K0Z2_9AGAM|nr:uncharacterized protein F5147DRAFT_756637 [Suillus discolor]KAG2120679.1 hypothetical protein F5147DRAFT_756637 [Suillus discolor]
MGPEREMQNLGKPASSITLAYVYGPFGGVADFRDLGIGNNEELHHTLRGSGLTEDDHISSCETFNRFVLKSSRTHRLDWVLLGLIIWATARGNCNQAGIIVSAPGSVEEEEVLLGLWRPTWIGVNVCANLCLRRAMIHNVSAHDAKDTQLTITPTHSNVQHEVSLKIGLPSGNVRDKDTSKERMVVQVHLPQIQADDIPRRRRPTNVWEQKREP